MENMFPHMPSIACVEIASAWFGVNDGCRTTRLGCSFWLVRRTYLRCVRMKVCLNVTLFMSYRLWIADCSLIKFGSRCTLSFIFLHFFFAALTASQTEYKRDEIRWIAQRKIYDLTQAFIYCMPKRQISAERLSSTCPQCMSRSEKNHQMWRYILFASFWHSTHAYSLFMSFLGSRTNGCPESHIHFRCDLSGLGHVCALRTNTHPQIYF